MIALARFQRVTSLTPDEVRARLPKELTPVGRVFDPVEHAYVVQEPCALPEIRLRTRWNSRRPYLPIMEGVVAEHAAGSCVSGRIGIDLSDLLMPTALWVLAGWFAKAVIPLAVLTVGYHTASYFGGFLPLRRAFDRWLSELPDIEQAAEQRDAADEAHGGW